MFYFMKSSPPAVDDDANYLGNFILMGDAVTLNLV